ncbi:S1C family serine protease [Shewanella sp. HL-SH4]|uniref:S1C family serine protease n=1 Tax=Shewanella sp. HL-SH4 TaxID=3436240 RepID=UPI003EBEAE10
MKNIFLLAIGIIIALTGCKSTPNNRQVSDVEVSNYMSKVSDITDGTYSSYWIQPRNKTEKCQFLMEGYNFEGYPQSKINPEDIHWDGGCKNGKTHGLGKMTVNAGSLDWYEIAYHNEGITDRHYYRAITGNNNVNYGMYWREGNRSTKSYEVQGTTKPDGSIDLNYAFLEIDSKRGLSKGVVLRKYGNGGEAKYTGVFGNKLFFGTGEFFNSSNSSIATFWGFVNMANEKPESYVILKNQQGLWHQYYEFGNLVEYVQLPQSYTSQIMSVASDSGTAGNMASNAGQLALAMKKKYDASKQTSATVKSEPNKPKPEYSKSVATGTGFFISNDGYLLTNSHVIEGSSSISIILNGKSVPASLVDHDSSNDIALLKVDKSVEGLSIELKKKTKQGTEIAVLGYPNIGLQGNEQKATFGFINANSGIQGDTRYFQISSPIQPGNSGSPMVNEMGTVIGIASASLNQNAAIKSTGTLAQNVNYAVKIAYALPMLINHGVEYTEPVGQKTLEKTDLIESISNSVVLVVAE